jgi:hypothetical protein
LNETSLLYIWSASQKAEGIWLYVCFILCAAPRGFSIATGSKSTQRGAECLLFSLELRSLKQMSGLKVQKM